MKPKKVIIDRNKWLRGMGPNKSYLWNSELGKGCCLGHVLNKAHRKSYESMDEEISPIDLAYMEGKSNPLCLTDTNSYSILCTYYLHSDEIKEAMRVNDNRHITDDKREAHLKEILLPLGYDLEFIN